MRKLFLFLLLAGVALAQAPIAEPPVKFSDKVGPGGKFPFFEGGAIQMGDADHTMIYPEFMGSVIQLQGSLTQARTLYAPATDFGFEYTIQNKTTGGYAVTVKPEGNTGATGVTIPANESRMVIFDGSDYVSVGAAGGAVGPSGGGWGNIVPNPFATIQAAITAGGGPVVVLPSSTDITPYTNLPNMRVQNYRMSNGGNDSLFFRDVSEWGPVDGAGIGYCNTTQGSATVVCGSIGSAYGTAAGFVPTDQGKLIVLFDVGPPTGQVNSGVATVNPAGLTPGTPNSYQPIVFTDAGDCYSNTNGTPNWKTQPYGHTWLDSTGMPSGAVITVGTKTYTTGRVEFPNFPGKGCTHPPTTGTIATVGGTATFTGGTMTAGDVVSTIATVNSASSITLADTVPITGRGAGAFGSDIHDTFQAACNAYGTAVTGGILKSGTLTFSGMGLTSRGIDCLSAGLKIMGQGYNALSGSEPGSALVYAGKDPNAGNPNITGQNHSYILNLETGGGARVERMRFDGNSQAIPYALMLSFPYQPVGPIPKGFINSMGIIDQVWFGWMWGDVNYANAYTTRLQSCIFGNGVQGNTDFWTFDHIYCEGADTGLDSVNDQATNWHIGKWHSDYSNIGLAVVGGTTIDDYYTEGNRVDLVPGSPYHVLGFPTGMHIINYDGESSAMMWDDTLSVSSNTYSVLCESCGGGGNQASWGRPDGVTHNFSGGAARVNIVKWSGGFRGLVIIPYRTQPGTYVELNGVNSFALRFPAGTNAGCSNTDAWGASGTGLKLTGPYLDLNIPGNYCKWITNAMLTPDPASSTVAFNPPLMLDAQAFKSQVLIGSLNVQSTTTGFSAGQSYGVNSTVFCNGTAYNPGTSPCGTKTYRYEMTCTDSLGNESAPVLHYSGGAGVQLIPSTGPPALNANSYIQISVTTQRTGCATYNVYGDNGLGDGVIGWLASVRADELWRAGRKGLIINDQGQYTKSTTRLVPTSEGSGTIFAAGRVLSDTGMVAPQFTAGTPPVPTPRSGTPLTRALPAPSHDSSFRAYSANGTNYLDINVPNSGNPSITSSTGAVTVSGLTGGTGPGGPVSLSDVTDPIGHKGFNLGQNRLTFYTTGRTSGGSFDGSLGVIETTPSSNVNQYLIVARTAPGSVTNPFVATTGVDISGTKYPDSGLAVLGNGNIHIVGNAKIKFENNAMHGLPSLATDPEGFIVPGSGIAGSAPIYSRTVQFSFPPGAAYFAPQPLPECDASSYCTMVTPAVDATYRFVWQLNQIAPGSGGTCTVGTMSFFFIFTDADSGAVVQTYAGARTVGNSGTLSQFQFAGAANPQVVFGYPIEFRAKAGGAIRYRFLVNIATNCDTPPLLIFRPALYAMGY